MCTRAVPRDSWSVAGNGVFIERKQLLARAQVLQRPLAKIKDAAYAVRQAVFYISMQPSSDQLGTITELRSAAMTAEWPMSAVGAGLHDAATSDSWADTGRPFLT